jgi:hypothetical protein
MRRGDMTYRVIPLHSPEAAKPPTAATVAERLEMVRALSVASWASGHKSFPQYTRETMPVRLSRLADQGGPTDR